jgi:hypothetical protein
MATVVLRVVPVLQLILPTVTTLTVIVHVRRARYTVKPVLKDHLNEVQFIGNFLR